MLSLALPSASSLSLHLFRAVIYLNIQVVKGQRKVICLLKEQIQNVSGSLCTFWVHPSVHLACGLPCCTSVVFGDKEFHSSPG